MTYDVVTGGCGFIGSHLVDALLERGRQVLVIDTDESRKNLKHHQDNWRLRFPDESNIEEYTYLSDVDTVFHLAALADIVPSIVNPRQYYLSNVNGTYNILEAALKGKCRKFIYAASSSCYGDKPTTPTPETAPIFSQYPYALTKNIGEQIALHWLKVYKLPVVSLRLFNVYGTRSRTNGTYGAMFGTFLAQLANGKPLTIVGDGTQKRDFVHVSDVVNAMLLAANSDYTGVYNIGSGKPISVNKIADLLGATETVFIPKRPGEPDITHADISKAQKDLGWTPKISIGDGVKQLLDNIQGWKDAPVWTPEKIKQATVQWMECLA